MRRIDKGEHALGPGQSNELLPWQAAARHGANTVKKQKLDSVVAVLFARGVNGRLVKLYHLVFVAQRVVQRHALVHNTLLLGKEIKRFEASAVGGGRTNDNVAGLKAPRPQNSVDTNGRVGHKYKVIGRGRIHQARNKLARRINLGGQFVEQVLVRIGQVGGALGFLGREHGLGRSAKGAVVKRRVCRVKRKVLFAKLLAKGGRGGAGHDNYCRIKYGL